MNAIRESCHQLRLSGLYQSLARRLEEAAQNQLTHAQFLELVVRRHRNHSTMMTSNRPIEEWGQLLGDVPAATSILDRFLQQAEIVRITGRSHRLRGKTNGKGEPSEDETELKKEKK